MKWGIFEAVEKTRSTCFKHYVRNVTLNYNRACAGLRHAIVIASKPHFRVTSSLNNKARFGGDNNSVT